MTKEQAYKELGVTKRSSIAKIEQAYKVRSEKLQLHMLPGYSQCEREYAAEQMAKLASAVEVLRHASTNPVANKAEPRSGARKKPRASKPSWSQPPDSLAEAWDQFFSMLPFSPVVNLVVVLASIILLVAMILSSL